MLSYWERQSFTKLDIVVIGAGITGLNTAIELQERYPSRAVTVLERGIFGAGASTRNAGFACMGSLSELLEDLSETPADKVVALFERRKLGLEKLRNRLGDEVIDYRQDGSHDLLRPGETGILEHLDRINELLLPVTGKRAFENADRKIEAMGFKRNEVAALIENTCEGQIDTGKMMRSLMLLAAEKGVMLHGGTQVANMTETREGVELIVLDPVDQSELLIKAKEVFICTNAFTQQLLPDIDLQPGRGQVLITKPIQNLKLKGVYHFDKGYYYFRELHGRVLFGGGRNLDFKGEATTTPAINNHIQQHLEHLLRTIILPHTPFEVDMRWAGIMAFGKDKQPVVKRIGEHTWGAFRMGGMGVALGAQVACELACMFESQTG